jgi:hypothetical protein
VFNRALAKNISVWDLPHQLRLTAQYQVPRFRDSSIAFVSNRVVSSILSDWGIGVYVAYQSAGLLTRPSSNLNPNLNNFYGRGPGSAQLKKDADGNYMSPWSVNWVDNGGNQRTDPIDINCHCFDPTKTIVLNPAAWENVPAGQWAADQTDLRFYRGIRYPVENANLGRNFRFGEGRVNLNVRVEFNNIFNRMQIPQPAAGGNFATAPTQFTTGANAGLNSGGFGSIVPTSGTMGMRTGTFVGRITF